MPCASSGEEVEVAPRPNLCPIFQLHPQRSTQGAMVCPTAIPKPVRYRSCKIELPYIRSRRAGPGVTGSPFRNGGWWVSTQLFQTLDRHQHIMSEVGNTCSQPAAYRWICGPPRRSGCRERPRALPLWAMHRRAWIEWMLVEVCFVGRRQWPCWKAFASDQIVRPRRNLAPRAVLVRPLHLPTHRRSLPGKTNASKLLKLR